jgi:hypothetical protein
MYKSIMGVVVLTFALFIGPSVVGAQQGAPGEMVNPGSAVQTTESTDQGFDWRWLLLLLPIPFLFFFRSDKSDRERSDYQDHRFAGTKGGEAKSDKNGDNFS